MFGTMRRPRLTLLAVAATLWVSLATAQAAETKTVTPQGSFISAELTGEVSRTTATVKTAVGEIVHHTVSARVGDATLSITATIVPSIVSRVLTAAILYRKARSELVGRYSGKVVSWKSCKHAGYDCRLLRYETKDGRNGLARLYFHAGTLVVLNAVYRDAETTANAFLDSAA
jgi:hypothetical protein